MNPELTTRLTELNDELELLGSMIEAERHTNIKENRRCTNDQLEITHKALDKCIRLSSMEGEQEGSLGDDSLKEYEKMLEEKFAHELGDAAQSSGPRVAPVPASEDLGQPLRVSATPAIAPSRYADAEQVPRNEAVDAILMGTPVPTDMHIQKYLSLTTDKEYPPPDDQLRRELAGARIAMKNVINALQDRIERAAPSPESEAPRP